MKKLDYASTGEVGIAYYRILCSLDKICNETTKSAYLVCFAKEGTLPILLGSYTILSGKGIEKSYPIRIVFPAEGIMKQIITSIR